MGNRLFTEYGIKILGFGEPRHDPTSYHNGSIWPHDNSIILKGLADYGLCDEFSAGSKAMLNAFKQLGLPGLPELYTGSAPPKPMGNFPQSWASGAAVMMLQGMLGISFSGNTASLRPCIPDWLKWMEVRNIDFHGLRINIKMRRRGNGVSVSYEVVNSTRKAARMEVVIDE